MITLAFDTETDKLVLPKQKPTHPDQPHLVELGCVLYDGDVERVTVNFIVDPQDRTIPDEAANVHGITTATARRLSIPLIVACAVFSHLAKLSDRQVGHNIEFDIKVLMAEFHRLNRPFPATNPRCTKNMAEPVLQLPPTERMLATGMGHKFKSPTLTECWRFLFDEDLVGAHGALTDARACARVLFELEKRSEQRI